MVPKNSGKNPSNIPAPNRQSEPLPDLPTAPDTIARIIQALTIILFVPGDNDSQPTHSNEPSLQDPSPQTANPDQPEPKKPHRLDPLLNGSKARALCRLVSAAEEWVLALASGHTPSFQIANDEFPCSPPADLETARIWLHHLRHLVLTRATNHLTEATRLAVAEGRDLCDADNRVINLMLRLDPLPAIARHHRTALRKQHTTGGWTPSSTSSGGWTPPSTSSQENPSPTSSGGWTPPSTSSHEGPPSTPAPCTAGSQPTSRAQKPSSAKSTRPKLETLSRVPKHSNPSKQYKRRKPQPQPTAA